MSKTILVTMELQPGDIPVGIPGSRLYFYTPKRAWFIVTYTCKTP